MTGFSIADIIGRPDAEKSSKRKRSDNVGASDDEGGEAGGRGSSGAEDSAASAAAAVAAAAGFGLPGPLQLWNQLARLPAVQQQQQQQQRLLQPQDPRLWLHSLHARFQQASFHPGVRIPAPEAFLFQGFRKPKRIRTAFSPSQLLQLEKAFEKNHYVVGQERKELAAGLNLSETQVKVWFQNRRTKYKRVRTDDQTQDSDPDSSKVVAADDDEAAAMESGDEDAADRSVFDVTGQSGPQLLQPQPRQLKQRQQRVSIDCAQGGIRDRPRCDT